MLAGLADNTSLVYTTYHGIEKYETSKRAGVPLHGYPCTSLPYTEDSLISIITYVPSRCPVFRVSVSACRLPEWP